MKKLLFILLLCVNSLSYSEPVDTLQKPTNSSLEESLAKMVNIGIKMAEKTGQFVIEQAPDILKEFYIWRAIENIIGILVVLIIVTMIRSFIKNLGKEKESHMNDQLWDNKYYEDAITTRVLYNLVGVLYFIAAPMIVALFKIWLTPKIYIIDYFLNPCGC